MQTYILLLSVFAIVTPKVVNKDQHDKYPSFYYLRPKIGLNKVMDNSFPVRRSLLASKITRLSYYRYDPGSIAGLDMRDGHVFTRTDRSLSSGYYGFLSNKDHTKKNMLGNENGLLSM